MNNPPKQVMEFCIEAGEILLASGAEIFRVQDTLERIAKNYQIKQFHVYVISNGLFVSMNDGYELYTTQIRYVPLAPTHIGRICAINDLSRKICTQPIPIEEAIDQLETIKNLPFSSNIMQILASGIGAAMFCFILGGSINDSIASMGAGLILYVFLIYTLPNDMSKIICNILASTVASLTACFIFQLGLGNSLDHIIIGSIIPLVPGVLITTAIRDILNSDYVSGMIHMLDAILVASCIACGVGIALYIYQMLGVVL